MNSHLNGIFLVFHFQLGSSCVCYHLWLCHRARYHSLVRSQNELESSSSISIEMCLHWHQYSSTFLMPPVRIPPHASTSLRLSTSSSLLLIFLLLPTYPYKLLMQGNPGLHQYNYGLDTHIPVCILVRAGRICMENTEFILFTLLNMTKDRRVGREMVSEMDSYWLTLAMGLFICWLLGVAVKCMC